MKYLESLTELQLAIVYGSFGANRENPSSDLDLAVAFAKPLSVEERVDLAAQVAQAVGREVDLVDLKAAHGLILEEVLTKGQMVIKRDSRLHAELIKRMWLEKADFGLLRSRLLATRRKRVIGA
ncbi:MAG: nucleotidyltransferase domain-containing protein [Bdellovibrionota bacterium]